MRITRKMLFFAVVSFLAAMSGATAGWCKGKRIVPAPTVSISANQGRVLHGGSTTLNLLWSNPTRQPCQRTDHVVGCLAGREA